MEFGSGGEKKDVARSTRQVQGQGMCGLGVWCAWYMGRCSEMSKPRLLAHAHVDAYTKI